MIDIQDYVVLDLEMTGLSAKQHKIIEIGAVFVRGNRVVDTLEILVKQKGGVPERITELTGITNHMLDENGIAEEEAMLLLLEFIGSDIIIGHNVNFDYSFIKQWEINHKMKVERFGCDTLKIARALLPVQQSKKLEDLCGYFGIERVRNHRALDDALETYQIFERLKQIAQKEAVQEALFVPRPLVYHAKKQTPATAQQVRRLKEYCALHHITDEILYETLTRSEASRIMDKYISIYGR